MITQKNTGTVRHGDFYPGRGAVIIIREFESCRDQSAINEILVRNSSEGRCSEGAQCVSCELCQ
jgi:hypothetical protein